MRYVVVDGNIGAGKTTLMSLLEARGLSVVTEPVDVWCSGYEHRGITETSPISMYYEDPVRNAVPFQLHVLTTCVKKMTDAFDSAGDAPVVIERDPFDLDLFIEDNFREERFSAFEHRVFCDLVAAIRRLVPAERVGCVYLRLSPEKCLARIRKRMRTAEMTIGLEYLTGLHDLHERKYDDPGCPSLIVDASVPPGESADAVAEFVLGLQYAPAAGTEEDRLPISSGSRSLSDSMVL